MVAMQNSKKILTGVQMMERLTQVTEDLENIVKITQGKKPDEPSFKLEHLIHQAEKKGKFALFDVYRALALYNLVNGRQVVTAYFMGRKAGQHFSLSSSHELIGILQLLGINKICCKELADDAICIQLDSGITCRGLNDAKRPVCYFEAGLLASLLEKVCKKKVEIQETKCCGTGDKLCQFENLKPKKTEQHKNPYAAAFMSEGYAEENIRLLTTLASHALTAIDNTLLFEKTRRQAVIDSLTEIYNHRYFQQTIRTELRRAQRHQLALSLIMIDVDNFKLFNDRHGHPKGDQLLKTIAAFLKSTVRDIDIVARYGGDEFAIILPQTNTEGAIRVADRIRSNVRELCNKFREKDFRARLGLSLGITSLKNREQIEAQKFIEQADKALLRAKRKGSQLIGLHRPRKILSVLRLEAKTSHRAHSFT